MNAAIQLPLQASAGRPSDKASEPRLTRGTDKCQCPTCLLFFKSTAGFDAHRVGRYQPNERRCLTTSEMRARGMALDSSGFWVTKRRPVGPSGTAKIAEISSTPWGSGPRHQVGGN